MEIILKKDVQNLGFKDDVVNVKNGYGRNFLIPQGKAIMATVSARKVLTENLISLNTKFTISYIGLLPKQSNPKILFKVLAPVEAMFTVAVLRPPVKFAFNRTEMVVLATVVPVKVIEADPADPKLSDDNSKSVDAVLTTKLFVKLEPETKNDCETDGPAPV